MVLPLQTWNPFLKNKQIYFYPEYLHQVISGVSLVCMHLCMDTIFTTFMLQLCHHIQLLSHRLENFSEHPALKNTNASNATKTANLLLTKYIKQHQMIYKSVNLSNKIYLI